MSLRLLFSASLPQVVPVSSFERLRASLGAAIGILLIVVISALAVGSGPGAPLLIAPLGASAVLLFAVPSSPLAQPWSIIVGNGLAASVGVTCSIFLPDAMVAAALAIGVSIAMMLTIRCLHPPSGAVALTAVIGGTSVTEMGYLFVLWPVLASSVLLVGIATVFNRATGKTYPHRVVSSAAQPDIAHPQISGGLGVTVEDLSVAIGERDEVLPVDPHDLEEVLQRAEILAFARRSGGVLAGSIMSRGVTTVAPETSLRVALGLLRSHQVKALPVVAETDQVVGILTQSDLLDKADWGPAKTSAGLGWRLRAITNSDRPLKGKVRDIMTTRVRCVPTDLPIARVIQVMAETRHHHLTVVSKNGKLVGILTQSDVVSALFHVNAAEFALSA